MRTWAMKRWAAVAGLVMLAGAGAVAHAQIAPGGGPIDIAADSLTVDEGTRTQTWAGHVEALQGTNRLRADKIVVYHGKAPANAGGDRGGVGLGHLGTGEKRQRGVGKKIPHGARRQRQRTDWGGRPDLNRRHPESQSGALTN